MYLRKRRALSEMLFDPQPENHAGRFCPEFRDPAPNPEQVYELHQLQIGLMRAIGRLDPGLREPIRMQIAKESSLKEIGRALNLSEGAVKARLYRARLRLSVARQ
jgi:RNA polymerase sigma factor (sigma-70 family)